MKFFVFVCAMFSLLALCHGCQTVQTKEQASPLRQRDHDKDGNIIPIRKCEIDLNGDGLKDLIICHNVSLGGTGGFPYWVYLKGENDQFREVDRILAGAFALDEDDGNKLLWGYSHLSAGSGHMWYSYFDRQGRYQRSPSLLIRAGDSGSETGNAIYKAIFNPRTLLVFDEIK